MPGRIAFHQRDLERIRSRPEQHEQAAHPVATTDAIAKDAASGHPLLVATDARRKEVYWAAYSPRGADGRVRRAAGPEVVRPAGVATELPVAGPGSRLYPEFFPNGTEPEYPSAATLADAYTAGAVEVVPPDPLYLRRPDARPPGERKPVLAT